MTVMPMTSRRNGRGTRKMSITMKRQNRKKSEIDLKGEREEMEGRSVWYRDQEHERTARRWVKFEAASQVKPGQEGQVPTHQKSDRVVMNWVSTLP